MQDRNPLHYIPAEFRQRAETWLTAARSVVSETTPFAYMAVEDLMYAERPILAMERRLAHREGLNSSPGEPLLLMECSTLSILWICGLYEVTRGLRASKSPRWAVFSDLHNSLAALRMPLAKHEVWRNEDQEHHPTSVWCPESGQVGWRVYNPQHGSMKSYFRTKLADEFLVIATKIEE